MLEGEHIKIVNSHTTYCGASVSNVRIAAVPALIYGAMPLPDSLCADCDREARRALGTDVVEEIIANALWITEPKEATGD
jgi:hypothetical protein